MVIVQFSGGLGNQMFQYALYLQLQSLGREVKIDDASGFLGDAQRSPALAPFGISYERPTQKELRQMLDSSLLPWHRVRRKLFGRKKKAYFEESKLFLPQVFTWDDIYLEGYWQSWKYFQAVEEKVRAAFDTEKLLNWLCKEGHLAADRQESGAPAERVEKRNGAKTGGIEREKGSVFVGNRADGQQNRGSLEAYLEKINNTCSVSLHVRRGDYLTAVNQSLFGGICTEAYYMEGIRRMRKRHPDCRFYLFCNDKAWARQAFGKREGFTLVDISGQGGGAFSDYAEFLLMSRCRHHILANSSFSWWASYLNGNPEKTVLAPPRWLNGADCSDLYRADMEKVLF